MSDNEPLYRLSPMSVRARLESLVYDERCRSVYEFDPRDLVNFFDYGRQNLQVLKVILEYSLHMEEDYSDEMKQWYETYHDLFVKNKEYERVYTKYHSLYTSLQSRLASNHLEKTKTSK